MFPPADDPPDLAIPPNRGPLPVRRNPNPNPNPRAPSGHQRDPRPQGIRVARAHRGARRGSFCTMWRFLSGSIAFSVLFIVFLMVMQTKIRVPEQGWSFLDGIKSGKSLKFGQGSLLRRFGQRNGLDHLRSEMRIGVRRPTLALVSFCFENWECLCEIWFILPSLSVLAVAIGIEFFVFDLILLDLCWRILLWWVLQLRIGLLGFDLTVLDLCGLILVCWVLQQRIEVVCILIWVCCWTFITGGIILSYKTAFGWIPRQCV